MAVTRYSIKDFDDAFAAAGIEAEPQSLKGSSDNTKQRRSGPRQQPELDLA
jgi:hypothetical protein